MTWPRAPKAPWWFTVLLVLAVIAAMFMFPEASSVLDSAEWMGADYVAWVYPLYIGFSAVLAWICYPQRRPMAWILFALLVLASIGLFIATLANPVASPAV